MQEPVTPELRVHEAEKAVKAARGRYVHEQSRDALTALVRADRRLRQAKLDAWGELCPKCEGSGTASLFAGATIRIATVHCSLCNGEGIVFSTQLLERHAKDSP